ncbi:MAG TPA: hypothetical protein VF647_10200 [Longimicrobium sp.]|jgi:hypothetical protein
MKLESLKNDLFAPMSTTEAAAIKGGLAQATSSTVWSNTWVNGQYIGLDKDVFTDESPAPQQPATQLA